jgi:NAD(P)-dependent dehydrogenase (short-subunit alcohol dehydrogenase family)
MMDYSNKVVMITGANRGIGKAIADKFYSQGAYLALGIRNIDRFSNIYDPKRVLITQVDVRVDDNLYTFSKIVQEHYGNIDILINNAGVDQPCSIFDITKDYLDDVMNTNFTSMVLLTKYVVQNMVKNKSGNIINLSSIAGKEGTANHIAYTASKHAVIGFTKCLARELITYGIRVNAICPGLIQTDMLTNYFADLSKQTGSGNDQELIKMIEKTPRKVIGNPLDVANLITFLCSDQAENIIGQCLNTDGGMLQF